MDGDTSATKDTHDHRGQKTFRVSPALPLLAHHPSSLRRHRRSLGRHLGRISHGRQESHRKIRRARHRRHHPPRNRPHLHRWSHRPRHLHQRVRPRPPNHRRCPDRPQHGSLSHHPNQRGTTYLQRKTIHHHPA